MVRRFRARPFGYEYLAGCGGVMYSLLGFGVKENLCFSRNLRLFSQSTAPLGRKTLAYVIWAKTGQAQRH